MFEYGAKLVRVVDGDTLVLDLDLGFYQSRVGQPYRLLRINAPELNTPEGKAAKMGLEGFLWTPGGLAPKVLVAQTQRSDHFGRFLAEVLADGKNVSDYLVTAGFARYQTY